MYKICQNLTQHAWQTVKTEKESDFSRRNKYTEEYNKKKIYNRRFIKNHDWIKPCQGKEQANIEQQISKKLILQPTYMYSI